MSAGAMRSTPCFFGRWLFGSGRGLLGFRSLSMRRARCARACCCRVSPSPSLVLLLEETCVHVQALQQRAPGPSCQSPASPRCLTAAQRVLLQKEAGRAGCSVQTPCHSLQSAQPHRGHWRCKPRATPGSQEQPRHHAATSVLPGAATVPRGDKRPFLRSRTPSPDRRSLRAGLWSGSHLLLQSLNPLHPSRSMVKNATAA